MSPLRKKTLRRMSPQARKLARLIGELESVERRLWNLLPEITDLEFWASAAKKQSLLPKKLSEHEKDDLF